MPDNFVLEVFMAGLVIKEFREGCAHPDTTVRIPGAVLTIASKLIPRKALEALHEQGIDLEEIVRLSKDPEIKGTIAEIEDHKENKRVEISVE
jgi:hypothetical protein